MSSTQEFKTYRVGYFIEGNSAERIAYVLAISPEAAQTYVGEWSEVQKMGNVRVLSQSEAEAAEALSTVYTAKF